MIRALPVTVTVLGRLKSISVSKCHIYLMIISIKDSFWAKKLSM